MKRLFAAELLKLRSTRMPLWLLLATLALTAMTVIFNVPRADAKEAVISLDDPRLLAVVVGITLGVAEVMVAILGVLASTQEIRYGTASSTYLVEPRRARVLVAKCLSSVLAGLVIATVTLVFSAVVGVGFIRYRDGNVTAGAQFWQVCAVALLVMSVYGVIGVAVGALVPNQIAAVVGVLVWMLAVEYVLVPALPTVGRWTPWGAASGALQLAPSLSLDGRLLSARVGALVLVGYAAAAVVLTVVVVPRRDVL